MHCILHELSYSPKIALFIFFPIVEHGLGITSAVV